MSRDKELLRQALDVLGNIRAIDLHHADGEEVLEAIHTRLAEPEEAAEPVAWMVPGVTTTDSALAEANGRYAIPLFLHPPRPAVRLDNEEIAAELAQLKGDILLRLLPFVRAIEAAVLRKNGLEVKDE